MISDLTNLIKLCDFSSYDYGLYYDTGFALEAQTQRLKTTEFQL